MMDGLPMKLLSGPNIVLYSIVICCNCCRSLKKIRLEYMIVCCIMLYYTIADVVIVLYHVILYYTILYYIILCCIV